jgi:hypothetical protein
MKAILEFDLSDIDERATHLRAIKADKAYAALWHITQLLREKRKYHADEPIDIEKLENDVWMLINDEGINLDEEYR